MDLDYCILHDGKFNILVYLQFCILQNKQVLGLLNMCTSLLMLVCWSFRVVGLFDLVHPLMKSEVNEIKYEHIV